MKNKAFTLIELMIIIAILGILAVLAIPAFTDTNKTQKQYQIICDSFRTDWIPYANMGIYTITYRTSPNKTSYYGLKKGEVCQINTRYTTIKQDDNEQIEEYN